MRPGPWLAVDVVVRDVQRLKVEEAVERRQRARQPGVEEVDDLSWARGRASVLTELDAWLSKRVRGI